MTRKPVGVVGVITPFNFPIAIPAWKIAPALVYGNTVVWKPASTVPLLAMRLAQALHSAGLPAGVLNLLIGGRTSATAWSTTRRRRRHLHRIHRHRTAHRRGRRRRGVPVQAEMGGKNAAVVLDDADLDLAVEQVMLGAFRSTGQKCTATSRLIVTDGIADQFLERADRARRRADASATPPTTDTEMGPVVSDSAHRTHLARASTPRPRRVPPC